MRIAWGRSGNTLKPFFTGLSHLGLCGNFHPTDGHAVYSWSSPLWPLHPLIAMTCL